MGSIYKRYALLKHDNYPQGVLVHSWRTYFEPEDIDMLAGEKTLFRCITQLHQTQVQLNRPLLAPKKVIALADQCHIGELTTDTYHTTPLSCHDIG